MGPGLEDEVVEAARSGDPAAFHRLYVHIAPGVLGYFRGRGADDPEALTQDVFLALYQKLNTVRGGYQGLRTFIFTIAHARMVDEYRRRSRRPVQTEFDADTDGRVSESAEAVALAGMGGAVVQLLQELNAEQREVVLLRIVSDLPIEQVAEVVGKSPGSVKQLQRRGLAKLKELAEREEARL